MTWLLLALPWVGVLAYLLLAVRLPRELPVVAAADREAWPSVSVIVPARNEAVNIERCVASLTRLDYPDFEVIVVDDRSEDDTAEIARGVPTGNARRVSVLDGAELPEGWLGKPWACWQGAREAGGDLLLFTDADTRHEPGGLARAVAGLEEEGADLLTILGRQIMGSFWERLVQPQVFMTMAFRFPRFEETARNGRWRDAIANGQYILMPRGSYDAIGGHEAVKAEVVEDLVLAQVVKRAGRRLRIRSAESELATRMYRSLGELVDGWTKNILTGGMQSVPRALRPVLAPASFAGAVTLWIVPPLVLLLAALGFAPRPALLWAATVCSLSALIHIRFSQLMHAPPAYGLLYPLGAAVGAYIFLRSWVRGRRVEWKGRRYTLRPHSEMP